ncbi:MAG: tRNA (guanosine(46)-N7)-methyltransferase TrmB [Spirochaetaceae bacterium]|nr:tRNA (guanosine(46)-N7)-methyltransferase TrmB [Spirochaetaceae bacterium]
MNQENGNLSKAPLPEERRIKSYVLRGGRMSNAQRRSYEGPASRYTVPFAKGLLDLRALFGNESPVTVEIGFGMGLATAVIAQENPGKNYIGVEVFRPGIGRLLWEIEKREIPNIRIIEHDAVEVFAEMIPPASLAGIHIFFPDPWPKKRHHKRRLVKRPFTELLARRLRPSGYLYMVTDWVEYGEWALGELSATTGLRNGYESFAPHQDWRPRTKFETKGLQKNHEVRELLFKAEVP